jgi:ribosome maturation factor RimP
METGAVEKQVWDVVEPYLAAERLELDDLELLGRGRARTLRIVIDGDQGVDLDRIADVSKGLSRLLDASTSLEGPYQLEVTSPGLERKLTRAAHYRKAIGREVAVKTGAGGVRGTVTAASDTDFSLQNDEGQIQIIPYQEVVSARTIFRWERPPKPGHPDPIRPPRSPGRPGDSHED